MVQLNTTPSGSAAEHKPSSRSNAQAREASATSTNLPPPITSTDVISFVDHEAKNTIQKTFSKRNFETKPLTAAEADELAKVLSKNPELLIAAGNEFASSMPAFREQLKQLIKTSQSEEQAAKLAGVLAVTRLNKDGDQSGIVAELSALMRQPDTSLAARKAIAQGIASFDPYAFNGSSEKLLFDTVKQSGDNSGLRLAAIAGLGQRLELTTEVRDYLSGTAQDKSEPLEVRLEAVKALAKQAVQGRGDPQAVSKMIDQFLPDAVNSADPALLQQLLQAGASVCDTKQYRAISSAYLAAAAKQGGVNFEKFASAQTIASARGIITQDAAIESCKELLLQKAGDALLVVNVMETMIAIDPTRGVSALVSVASDASIPGSTRSTILLHTNILLRQNPAIVKEMPPAEKKVLSQQVWKLVQESSGDFAMGINAMDLASKPPRPGKTEELIKQIYTGPDFGANKSSQMVILITECTKKESPEERRAVLKSLLKAVDEHKLSGDAAERVFDAIGQLGDQEFIPELKKRMAKGAPNQFQAEDAARAILQLKTIPPVSAELKDQAIERLMVKINRDGIASKDQIELIGRAGTDKAVAVLEEFRKSSDPVKNMYAEVELARLGRPDAIEAVSHKITDPEQPIDVRQGAAGLIKSSSPSAAYGVYRLMRGDYDPLKTGDLKEAAIRRDLELRSSVSKYCQQLPGGVPEYADRLSAAAKELAASGDKEKIGEAVKLERYAQALKKCKDLGITEPFRYTPEFLVDAVDARERGPQPGQKTAVVAVAKDDPHGALNSLKQIKDLKAQGYTVMLYEVDQDFEKNRMPGSTGKSFEFAVVDATTERATGKTLPADLLIVAGHGMPGQTRLGAVDRGDSPLSFTKRTLDLGDAKDLQNLASQFNQDCSVVLISCSTGAETGNTVQISNVGSMFRYAIPQARPEGIVSPVAVTTFDGLIYNDKAQPAGIKSDTPMRRL